MNLPVRTALIGAFVCCAASAQAAIVIDQSTIIVPSASEYVVGSSIRDTTTALATGGTRHDTQDQVQTMTVGVTGELNRIGLQLYRTSATGTINFTLQKGAVYNPDGSYNDTSPTLIRYFSNIALPNSAQADQGMLVYFDLSALHFSVAAGDILSLGVSANPGTRAAWVLGTADAETDEDRQLISYDRGYNVIVAESTYSATPELDTFQRQISAYDRAFISYVDAATSAAAPLTGTPSGTAGAETFSFAVGAGERVFIDPAYAQGFDYVLGGGSPNILDVLFPALASDGDGYQIYTLGGTLLGTATAGQNFAFGPAGIAGFSVRGIDGLALGDPFVTGLTFTSAGNVTITQTPVPSADAVPEPGAWAMMLAGFGMVGFGMRRRNVIKTNVRFA